MVLLLVRYYYIIISHVGDIRQKQHRELFLSHRMTLNSSSGGTSDFRFSCAIGQPDEVQVKIKFITRPSSAACTLPFSGKWTQSISRPLHLPLACANSFTVHRLSSANCLQNVRIAVRCSMLPNNTCPFSNDRRSRRIKIKIIETISVSALCSL